MLRCAGVPCVTRQVLRPFGHLQRRQRYADIRSGAPFAKAAITALRTSDAPRQIKAQFHRTTVTTGLVRAHLRFTRGMREAANSYVASGWGG